MRRQLQSPKDMPHARHALLSGMLTAADLGHRLSAAASEEAEAVRRSLEGAQCYWVAPDMTAVALDAARDLPEWSAAIAAPSPSGLLVWRGSLPPVTAVRLTDDDRPTRPLRGVTWSRVDGAVRVMLLTDSSAPDLYPAPLVPVSAFALPILDPARQLVEAGGRVHPDAAGVIALLGATWILMQQETVSRSTRIQTPRRDDEAADRLGVSRPLITSVALRPMRHADVGRTTSTGRHLTVRHVVRGHWRRQYHPSDGSHRPTWIDSYIKGPEGAPLRLTEPVLVWRR